MDSSRSARAADMERPVQTKDELWRKTKQAIKNAFRADCPVLINAPPGSGKSHSLPEAVSDLNTPTTYLTQRVDLYDQMADWCRSERLSVHVLPSVYRSCAVFQDNNEYQMWQRRATTLHKNGVSGGRIHAEYNMPCGDDCEYLNKLDFDPREYDVLVGHYRHGYVTKNIENRLVVLDEFSGDGFIEEIENADREVSAFLDRVNLPYDNFSDLMNDRAEPMLHGESLDWVQVGTEVFDRSIIDNYENGDGHLSSRSGVLTLALLFMHDLGNGWESTRWYQEYELAGQPRSKPVLQLYDAPWRSLLPRKYEAVRRRDSDISTVWLRTTPDFTKAAGIIALDGTPTQSMWEAATGIAFREDQVIPKCHMSHYLRSIRGINVITAANGTKPYHTKDQNRRTPDVDAAITLAVEISHGKKPGLVTTYRTLEHYRADPSIDVLSHIDGTMNYASMLSSNQFASREIGVILGTPHPGDDVLRRWGALMGYAVDANNQHGLQRSYGLIGDDILAHFRENQVLQAILRFGRSPAVSEATVYLNHQVYPEWINADRKTPKQYRGNKRRKVIDELRRANQPVSAKELAATTEVSRRYIRRDILPKLTEDGHTVKTADEYRWITD